GAVQLAGSVTARKHQRATTSDWMELEKQRGISISSTVLQFDYNGYRLNLLDTPGHKDFSEDTYRVLTAVDSVVMVIDSAKGIDRQTRLMHLFERTVGGQFRAPVQVGGLHDPAVRGRLDDETFRRTVEELEMLEHAGHDWDDAAVLTEKTTPVFFGSASNNFGVQLLLDGFLKHSPPPKSRVIGGLEIS